MQTNNDIIEWEYAVSGDELESLREIADSYSSTLTSLMWDEGLIDKTKDNDDWSAFCDLCDDIWGKIAKTKSYDECLKIVNNEFFRIIRKYNITYTGRLKEIL